ncbi:MAG: putative HAD-hydrolase [Euryarchaeota archaeon]|nr:putative HAD-hydrolase [Euryarchaeota archaeon]
MRVTGNRMIKTGFFDLDGSLFDHQYSRRCGFLALKAMYPELSSADIRDMEVYHEKLIWANFTKVLSKEISVYDAMTERICTSAPVLASPLPLQIVRKLSGTMMPHTRRTGGLCPGVGTSWHG